MAVLTTYAAFRTTFATAGTLANDGLNTWPIAELSVVGFTSTLTMPPVLPSGFGSGTPMTITCNAEAADAVNGVDEYNWYVSQRTDTVADQYLTVVSPVGPPSKSGSIQVSLSALGQTYFGGLSQTSIITLFRNVDVYVQRISDDAIQHKLVLDVLLGD